MRASGASSFLVFQVVCFLFPGCRNCKCFTRFFARPLTGGSKTIKAYILLAYR